MSVYKGFSTTILMVMSLTVVAEDYKTSGNYIAAPAEVKAFVLKTKEALAITDPIKRCKAFPDIPGNQWIKGFTDQYCEQNYGDRITIDHVIEMVRAGKTEALDAEFAAHLERHFVRDGFSEVIHRDFQDFGATQQAGQVTDIWLKAAPDSPFALMARANYLGYMAGKARGGHWAKDTADENLKRMSEFVSLSIAMATKALELEPRLLPAHTLLVYVGRLDSRHQLGEVAFQTGMAIDPACHLLLKEKMISLQPRWNGTYPQMIQFANQVALFNEVRPLTSLRTVLPWADMGDRLRYEKKYDEAIDMLQPLTKITNNLDVLDDLIFSYADSRTKNQWEAIPYLLSYYRYEPNSIAVNAELARQLINQADDALFAIKLIEPSITKDQSNDFANKQLARAYLLSGQFDKGEEWVNKINTPNQLVDARYMLAYQLSRNEKYDRALAILSDLNEKFPEHSLSWWLRFQTLARLRRPGVTDAIRKFIETANRDDDWQRMEVLYAKKYLEKLEANTQGDVP